MSAKISINQLADFLTGTEAKRKRIIEQQKNPDQLRMAWYQLAKSRVRKVFQNNGDLQAVIDGISILKARKPEKKRQQNDKEVSIEALQRFVKMQIPSYLKNIKYEVVKPPKIKSIFVLGVEIIVSPDVIIKFDLDGKTYLGAIKIHISKSNAFDKQQQKVIAAALYKYLKTNVAKQNEVVLNDFCISLDIFGGGYAALPTNKQISLETLNDSCKEVLMFWNAA